MNILVVGGGGREHALVWKLAASAAKPRIFCAPGNPGIARHAKCFPIPPDDIHSLLALARESDIALAVVGPEQPLTLGIADRFWAEGIPVVGPTRAAAQIESSKAFAKEFMQRNGIPTAAFRVFDSAEAALEELRNRPGPRVVKADGLAAGKGVVVADDEGEAIKAVDAMMKKKAFGEAGARVILEERLEGREVTLLVFTDGNAVVPMVTAQDYKRIHDLDRGPNTGGMGACSPASVLDEAATEQILREVAGPAIDALGREGLPYKGVLYIGLILTDQGPRVLEFNARFGDPEAQVVLPRLETDLVDLMEALAHGRLGAVPVRWKTDEAVCVVMASEGYPESARKGVPIHGIADAEAQSGVVVFQAGTQTRGKDIVTAGGRVLGVTGTGKDLAGAREAAYAAVSRIRFDGMQFRKDIGSV